MAGLLSRYFGFKERSTNLATEVRAGFTTFMVMAYIIFVNPIVLGFTAVPGLDGKGLPFAATLSVTCLAAGLLSIAMGLASNYPFALAAGMGLNAVVAFDLVAGRGLTWPQAMTVVFLEGAIITVLVLTRFRQALMEAVPIGLKRAISVGIGLFIAFIGFFTSGLVIKPAAGPLPVGIGTFRGLPITVFLIGFVLTAWLMARRTRGGLLIGILATTALAIVLNEGFAAGRGFATPGAARRPGAPRRFARRPVRRPREQQQQHDLHRVGCGRRGGRQDRARVRRDGATFPGRDVLLAAGERHSGSGNGAGADHRGLLHDGDRARDSLGRLRGGHSGVHDDAGDAVHLVDHQRDRRGLRHLRRDQAASGPRRRASLDGLCLVRCLRCLFLSAADRGHGQVACRAARSPN